MTTSKNKQLHNDINSTQLKERKQNIPIAARIWKELEKQISMQKKAAGSKRCGHPAMVFVYSRAPEALLELLFNFRCNISYTRLLFLIR